MSAPIVTAYLLAAAGSWGLQGAAAAAVFQLQTGSTITGMADQTAPATSDAICAVRCADMTCHCGGFSRDEEGSCQLYRQPSFDSSGGGDQGRRSYRRAVPVSCPNGFTLCAGHCLYWYSKATGYTATYTEATETCASIGAHLAVPRSEAEHQCVQRMTQGSYRVWLGVNKAADGVFVGVDGLCPVPVENWWETGEPNGNGMSEPYVFAFTDGKWGDAPGKLTYAILCQMDGW